MTSSSSTIQASPASPADIEHCGVFVEPLPTLATRLPPLKSTHSSRGEIFCAASGRIVVYESSLERRAAMLFLASPDVVDIWDQPTPINYVDENGRHRSHTFDFLVFLKEGTKVAVAIKPFERAVATGLFDKMSLIALQLDLAFANKVVVLTERELCRIAVHEAELVLMARRCCDPDADVAVLREATSLIGAVRAQQLIDRLGLGARGFSAIVRAIGNRLLRRVSSAPLSSSSMIASLVSEDCL